jgi:hypothetical protein
MHVAGWSPPPPTIYHFWFNAETDLFSSSCLALELRFKSSMYFWISSLLKNLDLLDSCHIPAHKSYDML